MAVESLPKQVIGGGNGVSLASVGDCFGHCGNGNLRPEGPLRVIRISAIVNKSPAKAAIA
jgi:hypothetical protein